MACACHKCICVISISIFSECLFKTPYFDCYNKFYITCIKYSLRNQFINNKKSISVFLCYIYKRCLNYHTPSRYLCKYMYLKYFWFYITHLYWQLLFIRNTQPVQQSWDHYIQHYIEVKAQTWWGTYSPEHLWVLCPAAFCLLFPPPTFRWHGLLCHVPPLNLPSLLLTFKYEIRGQFYFHPWNWQYIRYCNMI